MLESGNPVIPKLIEYSVPTFARRSRKSRHCSPTSVSRRLKRREDDCLRSAQSNIASNETCLSDGEILYVLKSGYRHDDIQRSVPIDMEMKFNSSGTAFRVVRPYIGDINVGFAESWSTDCRREYSA
jgi:hypothetical protein